MSTVAVAKFDDAKVRSFLSGIKSKLKNIKDGGKKYTGLLSAIVFADILSHFEMQMGEDGPWAQWSKSYRKEMEKKGKGGNKILKDSGTLRNNFKPTDVTLSSRGFTWFNDAKTKKGFPYAFAHDNNTEPRTKLPRRSFMWLSDAALDKISVQTLQFMIDEGV